MSNDFSYTDLQKPFSLFEKMFNEISPWIMELNNKQSENKSTELAD